MLFWLAIFLLGALVIGTLHKSSAAKEEREIKLRSIRRQLAQKKKIEMLKEMQNERKNNVI